MITGVRRGGKRHRPRQPRVALASKAQERIQKAKMDKAAKRELEDLQQRPVLKPIRGEDVAKEDCKKRRGHGGSFEQGERQSEACELVVTSTV